MIGVTNCYEQRDLRQNISLISDIAYCGSTKFFFSYTSYLLVFIRAKQYIMSTITLNCLVVGENPYENAFNIEINLTKAVNELKETIKEKKAPDFNNFAADKLKLWKEDISLLENGKLSAVNTEINLN